MNPIARDLPSGVPLATARSRRPPARLSPTSQGSRTLSVLLGAVLLPTLLPASKAASLTIVNPGFEVPGGLAAGTFSVGAPPNYPFSEPGFGWSAFGVDGGSRSSGVLNPDSTTLYGSPVPDGSNVGVLFLWDNPGDQSAFAGVPAGLSQTLTAVLEAFTQYTLTVSVGNIANDVNAPHNQFQFTGFPGYSVNLLAGGVVVASDVNTQLPAEGGFATSTVQLSVGDFHAQLGQALGIQLINLNAMPLGNSGCD